MNNNLYKEKNLKKIGKFASFLETTIEKSRSRLSKFYVATDKLFNNEDLDTDDELLFVKPTSYVIYNPVETIYEDTSKKIPLYILESLRKIFEDHKNGNIDKEQLSFIEAILNGQVYTDTKVYKSIFCWFYFDRLSYRYSIPMANNLSAKKYHSYMITRLTNVTVWNKILNWD